MTKEKTNEEKTNEVAEKSSTALTALSVFEEDAGSGLENIGAEDVTVPRLKILQALSPEVNSRDGKYIKDSAAGDITNTVTRELFQGEEGCEVIPVTYKRYYLEWQPREDGGGLVKQHTDQAILQQTTKNDKNQDVLENGNYIQTSATHYALVVDGESFQTVMIPMSGTQLKKSRAWNSVASTLKVKAGDGRVFTPPIYSHKYKLTTVPESNDLGNWFGWNIELVGQLGDEEMFLYEAAKQFKESINFDASFGKAEEESPF